MSVVERLIAFADENDKEAWFNGGYDLYDVYHLNKTATFVITTDQLVKGKGLKMKSRFLPFS